ncbi:MAG TPA: rod-binding protein [Caulobacter sp.]|nr:rod-binding protein [Caulobacter sp.]
MPGPVVAPTDILLAQQTRTAASTADLAARKRQIADAAQSFEASFLSAMLQPMFASLSAEAPFGGGQGEEMFRSFLTDAISRQVAKAGGVGVADTVQREMLKLQGLTE